jgi:hypothetical protein
MSTLWNNPPKLSDKDLLFAFRCILQDAQIPKYCHSIDDFVSEFGYDCSNSSISEILNTWNSIQKTASDLNLSEPEIGRLLDALSKQGIE